MSLTLRLRGPQGQTTLGGWPPERTVAEFLAEVESQTGVPAGELELRSGFPPRPLAVPADTSAAVSTLGLRSGDTLVVSRGKPAAAPQPAPPAQAGAPEEPPGAAAGPAAPATQPAAPPPAPPAGAGDSTFSAPVLDEGLLVRRVIPSDNSCLFHAVGYVMEKSHTASARLREVVAEAVSADPERYTEAFLGKPPAEYIAWIKRPESWGGGIELSILSEHFGREIGAYSIQSRRCDLYGEGRGLRERALVLYDGLHYDALALSPGPDLPEDFDVTLFEVADQRRLAAVTDAATALTAKAHEKRQFTDTANFTLRCLVCQQGVRGEKEAVVHAKETGHQSFGEYQ
eukprot:TRINITY_DN596_c1_g1_i2.p1 TRINITY_DN596_c1_g1~~TRINITY_DN596_c1_g1_i2.p1  ORF type:complete len:367 (+),score=81.49 TRINITY_DN596_c1_g1_i2:72-1103(+)